jgi:hypothetical protein
MTYKEKKLNVRKKFITKYLQTIYKFRLMYRKCVFPLVQIEAYKYRQYKAILQFQLHIICQELFPEI